MCYKLYCIISLCVIRKHEKLNTPSPSSPSSPSHHSSLPAATSAQRRGVHAQTPATAAWTVAFPRQMVFNVAVGQNLVPLVNIKIAGKWMFIPLKMVLIGIDPYPNIFNGQAKLQDNTSFLLNNQARNCLPQKDQHTSTYVICSDLAEGMEPLQKGKPWESTTHQVWVTVPQNLETYALRIHGKLPRVVFQFVSQVGEHNSGFTCVQGTVLLLFSRCICNCGLYLQFH